MARLEWDKAGEKFFETGLDRGVLYLDNSLVVPWNGLTSVEELNDDLKSEPVYVDGLKYLDIPAYSDFSASMQAVTYPDDFLEYDGSTYLGDGVYIDDQDPKRFNLSYRTRIGDDLEGSDQGYKLHILYNMLAIPSDKGHDTITEQITPSEFTWTIYGVPEFLEGYKPTSHIVLDSRKLHSFLMKDIEDILYGTATTAPRFIPLQELYPFAVDWGIISIVDNGDGTWTASGPDELVYLTDPGEFQIDQVDATYLDVSTYQVSST